MHRSIGHLAPAPLLSLPRFALEPGRDLQGKLNASVWRRPEKLSSQPGGGLCEYDQHLSIFDFLCALRHFENRVIEYAPRNTIYYLFVRKCCCQHLTLFQHLNIRENYRRETYT
jgi:hypothetical protein